MNSDKNSQIIKNLISSIEKSKIASSPISEKDIKERIKTIDRTEVTNKLRKLGLGSVASMLDKMSDDDIIREISKNPSVLEKLNSMLKGGNA